MFSSPYIIIQFLLLLLSLYSSSSSFASSSTSSIKSNATSIYDVLHDYGLPKGLFPEGVKDFGVGDDGRFWVHLDQACNAKVENLFHYDRNVTGFLSYGNIDALNGMEAQDLFLWFRVMSISANVPSPGLIRFDVGTACKQLSLSLFETPPKCVAVGDDADADADADVDVSEGQSGMLQYKLDQGTSGRNVL